MAECASVVAERSQHFMQFPTLKRDNIGIFMSYWRPTYFYVANFESPIQVFAFWKTPYYRVKETLQEGTRSNLCRFEEEMNNLPA